jgi:hypothetical protein
MLISMPTGTSTIFGVFQDILISLCTGRFPSSVPKIVRLKNFASLLFIAAPQKGRRMGAAFVRESLYRSISCIGPAAAAAKTLDKLNN